MQACVCLCSCMGVNRACTCVCVHACGREGEGIRDPSPQKSSRGATLQQTKQASSAHFCTHSKTPSPWASSYGGGLWICERLPPRQDRPVRGDDACTPGKCGRCRCVSRGAHSCPPASSRPPHCSTSPSPNPTKQPGPLVLQGTLGNGAPPRNSKTRATFPKSGLDFPDSLTTPPTQENCPKEAPQILKARYTPQTLCLLHPKNAIVREKGHLLGGKGRAHHQILI